MTSVAQILMIVSIVRKGQKIAITCNTNDEERNLKVKYYEWERLKTGSASLRKRIPAKLYPQHDPPKSCLCLPKPR